MLFYVLIVGLVMWFFIDAPFTDLADPEKRLCKWLLKQGFERKGADFTFNNIRVNVCYGMAVIYRDNVKVNYYYLQSYPTHAETRILKMMEDSYSISKSQ